MGFEESGHIDPSLHPEFVGARERVDEEHEEKAGVDTDVVVAHGADGVDICRA